MDGIDRFRTPGQLIKGLLDARGWTQRTLAIILDVGEATVTRLASDKQAVDARMAILLEEVLGIAAGEFLSRQAERDLADARGVHCSDPERALRASLYGDLPVSEMIARGWLNAQDIRDGANVEYALADLFGVKQAGDIPALLRNPQAAGVCGPATAAQLAWYFRARQVAVRTTSARYTEQAVREALPRLRALAGMLEGVAQVPAILASCGIRFVIVEPLAAAKVDAACFWLNDEAPVVAVSLCIDRIDHFWFVLRHVLEHVLRLQGRGAAILDVELEGHRAGAKPDLPEAETAANEAAREFCIPSAALDAFIARKAPYVSDREMVRFARSLAVHPGILAGRVQPELRNRFQSHLAKVRATLLPNG